LCDAAALTACKVLVPILNYYNGMAMFRKY